MFTFTVRPEGGEPFEVKASTRDVLVWEQQVQGRSMSALVNDLHAADVYRVAHIASKRQHLFEGTQKEFNETCDLEIRPAEEPDPTQPEASAED